MRFPNPTLLVAESVAVHKGLPHSPPPSTTLPISRQNMLPCTWGCHTAPHPPPPSPPAVETHFFVYSYSNQRKVHMGLPMPTWPGAAPVPVHMGLPHGPSPPKSIGLLHSSPTATQHTISNEKQQITNNIQ
jgi:hypothetical protein